MEKLKELYNNKLKYKCFVESMQTSNNILYIVYISTSDFIIIQNFFGCVAIGKRLYNYDTKTIEINYIIKNDSITKSQAERIIKKYEKNFDILANTKYLINGIIED